MPNSLEARLNTLTYNSTDLQRSDLSVHFDILSGLNDGLTVRGADAVIPSAAGRAAYSRQKDVRQIVLVGTIMGIGVAAGTPPTTSRASDLAAWQDLRDELETLFDPSRDPATLSGIALDGMLRTISCRPLPGIVWAEQAILGVETCVVVLESVSPDWTVVAP